MVQAEGLLPQQVDGITNDSHDEELPPRPPYADVDGERIVPTTSKFPPMMNGYGKFGVFRRTFHLGPSAQQKLFAIETHSGGLWGNKPQIILSDGPDHTHPVLTTSASDNWTGWENEEFEWQTSSGAEIKDVGKRKSWGWKLTWMITYRQSILLIYDTKLRMASSMSSWKGMK
ncbi:hypothetical protein GQ53DRAFT_769107 [Thozetella sp. PMI_491]|nr:hypothetical protein GQ53DRAFT_769107 [Thozetella sp. PMI_491]